MVDDPIDRRAPAPPSVATTAAIGTSTGIAVGWVHWGYKCWLAHAVIPPDDALLEVTIFLLMPTVHLIGRIINNHLQKLAGENT